jgi:hypothetical protein
MIGASKIITITLHLNKTCVKAPRRRRLFFLFSILLYSEMDSESRGGRERQVGEGMGRLEGGGGMTSRRSADRTRRRNVPSTRASARPAPESLFKTKAMKEEEDMCAREGSRVS